MKNSLIVANPPGIGLNQALSRTGYTISEAIADLIDNSLDAEAGNINIITTDPTKLIIKDDGIGMSKETLLLAMRIGSPILKPNGSLGKFGIGLCSASLTLGDKLQVITKELGGEAHVGINDVSIMKKEQSFVTEIGESDEGDKALLLGDKGTTLVIELSNKINPGKLMSHIGRVFRKYISAGRNIYINDIPAHATDWLYENNEDTKEFTVKVTVADKNGRDVEDIDIKLVLLPKFDDATMYREHIGTKTQGFSVLRNGRELSKGGWFGMWDSDNHYNRIRGEVEFTSKSDEEFGITYSKTGVKLCQSLIDKIKRQIEDVMSDYKKISEDARGEHEDFKVSSIVSPVIEKFLKISGHTKAEVKLYLKANKISDPVCKIEVINSKYSVILNKSHKFYKTYIHKATKATQEAVVLMMFSSAYSDASMASQIKLSSIAQGLC